MASPARSSGWMRTWPRVAVAIAAALVCNPSAQAGQAGKSGLTVITLDLSTAPDAPAKKQPSAAWRTTFGSERRSEVIDPREKIDLGADIVLLQGVTNMRSLRRRFPPKSWRLVVSRQLLLIDDPLSIETRDGIAEVPTTAVAVRYQTGVRITGQDHLLALAKPQSSEPGRPHAAGTAVRIQTGGQSMWVLSLDLPDACLSDNAVCPQSSVVESWKSDRSGSAGKIVLGGRFATKSAVEDACRRMGLAIETAGERDRIQYFSAVLDPATGCAARTLLMP